MPITKLDLEKWRSPGELRDYVNALKDSVPKDPAEFKRALGKEGLYKVFLDELVALSCYALLAYPDDCSVKLVLGNQCHDAEVRDSGGCVVDRVELTVPQNGKAEADDRRLLVKRGIGRIQVGQPGDDREAMFPFVLETCRKKACKDYSGCTLVVAIESMPPFHGF